jgi:hypothetical protein
MVGMKPLFRAPALGFGAFKPPKLGRNVTFSAAQRNASVPIWHFFHRNELATVVAKAASATRRSDGDDSTVVT